MPKPPAGYVGIDVHAEDCVLCALDRQGQARLMRRGPTSIPLLRQALGFPGTDFRGQFTSIVALPDPALAQGMLDPAQGRLETAGTLDQSLGVGYVTAI